MFEYKDNVLMGQAADCCEAAANDVSCHIKHEANEDFDELARLVGEGTTLETGDDASDIDETALPSWTEVTEADAPRLEFDLEDELSRAFDGNDAADSVTPDPVQSMGPDFGARALQDALAVSDSAEIEQTPPIVAGVEAPVVEELDVPPPLQSTPIPVSEPETLSFDDPELQAEGAFAGLVSDEIEKALHEFDDEAGVEPADNTADLTEAEIPEAVTTGQFAPQELSDESLEDFSLELARLMGEPDATGPIDQATTPPQPSPTEPVMPWEAPEIVQQGTPSSEEDQQVPDPADQPGAPQHSYSQASAHLPPAAPLEVPPALEGSHVEDVLARADAFEAAATQNMAADEDLDYDLEAALSRELDAELETSVGRGDESGPGVIPPIYMPGADSVEKRQTGRRVAAGIVAVALLGGSAALAWSFVSSDTTEPPTILASKEPVKVKPKDTGGKVVPNQDQSVYVAVDGKDDGKPKQDALKDTSEKPIAVAKAPSVTAKPAETAGTASNGGGLRVGTTDPQTTGGPIVAPRRVRTVVVRPDGTILTQASTEKSEAAAQEEVALATSSEAPKPVAVKTVTTKSEGAAPKMEIAKPKTEPKPEPKTEISAVAEEKPVKPVEAAKPKPVETAPAKPEPAAKKPAPKPVKVAKVEPAKKPAKAVPAEQVADPLAPAKVSSPYKVQVSSRRSQEAAQDAYRGLASKFAGIIGGKGVDYQKTKVKGKDYYRVRIPAQSKAEAQRMCSQLKSRGGDCFVTR